MATLQVYWWRKASGALFQAQASTLILKRMKRHMSYFKALIEIGRYVVLNIKAKYLYQRVNYLYGVRPQHLLCE